MNKVFGPVFDVSRGRGRRHRAWPTSAPRRCRGSSSSTTRRTSSATTSTRKACSASRKYAKRALEPGAGRRCRCARPLQVRELPEGDLPGQRHQGGAAVRRALRRPELGSADQRPDRGGPRRPSTRSPAPAACSATPCSRPSSQGWMDEVDRAHRRRSSPTAGRATPSAIRCSRRKIDSYWRLDDEKLDVSVLREDRASPGITTICIHKGLLPADYEKSWPDVWQYATVWDVGQGGEGLAADQLHHLPRARSGRSSRRPTPRSRSSSRPATSSWATDLAEIPAKYGVKNVYGEIGTTFATCAVANPRFAAAFVGTLVNGHGRRPRRLGHATRCGTARRSGRSRPCAASRSPRTCRRRRLRAARRRRRPGQERDLRRATPRGSTRSSPGRARAASPRTRSPRSRRSTSPWAGCGPTPATDTCTGLPGKLGRSRGVTGRWPAGPRPRSLPPPRPRFHRALDLGQLLGDGAIAFQPEHRARQCREPGFVRELHFASRCRPRRSWRPSQGTRCARRAVHRRVKWPDPRRSGLSVLAGGSAERRLGRQEMQPGRIPE